MSDHKTYWDPDLSAGEHDTIAHWSEHFDSMDPSLSRGRFFRVSEEMRAQCPVAHSDRYEDGFWVLSSYEEIEQVHKNPETFSSYPVVCPPASIWLINGQVNGRWTQSKD